MAIDNLFPATSKTMLGTRQLYNNNNNNNNNNMNMVDTPTSGLVGTNNNSSGPGNINNLALTSNNNPNHQELSTINQGVPYSGIIPNVYSSSSGFVGQVVGTGVSRRSHMTRTGKINKKKDIKSITIVGGGGCSSSTSIINNDNIINFNNNEETIHSGHFMLSQVHEDTDDYEDDIIVKEENDSRTPEGFDFLSATKETSTSYNFDNNGCSQILSIDGSLTKLFECMTLAYRWVKNNTFCLRKVTSN